jgi:DNA mismatch repair protein MutS
MFIADAQTIADLGLFGKGAEESVYSLFNVTRTRGGTKVLEDMFRYPLSNADSINTRSGIIQYFAEHKVVFKFELELLDHAEQYLQERDKRTKLVANAQSLGQKLNSLVAGDPEIKNIQKGVAATLELLHGLRDFLNDSVVKDCPAYAAEWGVILAELSAIALDEVLGQPLKNKLSLEELSGYDQILRFDHHHTISKLLSRIYHLDVYLSAGKVGLEKGFAYPVAFDSNTCNIRISGFYHPLLKNAVPNDLTITPSGNVIFLTGANMAGKSTLMKSFGINVYLAHMGFPVAAKNISFSVLDGIFSTINLPDDLGMGISHFYAEVLRLKKVARELSTSKKLLVIFDELFRGTNVKDAYEGTIAVTKAFALNQASVFMVSTHITEAGDVLKTDCSNVDFKFLPTGMNENKPIYTYRLESGITEDRHGMVIITNEKILEILRKGRERLI